MSESTPWPHRTVEADRIWTWKCPHCGRRNKRGSAPCRFSKDVPEATSLCDKCGKEVWLKPGAWTPDFEMSKPDADAKFLKRFVEHKTYATFSASTVGDTIHINCHCRWNGPGGREHEASLSEPCDQAGFEVEALLRKLIETVFREFKEAPKDAPTEGD